MTGRERLLAAMQCAQPDRVPIVVRGVQPWDEAWVASRHPSYHPVIEAVARNCDWQAFWPASCKWQTAHPVPEKHELREEADWTLVTTHHITPAGELISRHRISKRGLPGLVIEYPVKSLADVECVLSVPYQPHYPKLDGLRALQSKIADRGVVIISFHAPIAFVHDLLGSELLALWSVERPDLIDALVSEFARRTADTLAYLLERDAADAYGFLGEEYLAPPLAGPEHFRRWVTEPERRLASMVRSAGKLVWMHCHGRLSTILEEFTQIGINCLHPVEGPPLGDVTLAEAKRRIGSSVCLEGNIQIGEIYSAPPGRIRQLVRQAIEQAAAGGGFILCPTASPHTQVLPESAVANYLEFVAAGLEFGRY